MISVVLGRLTRRARLLMTACGIAMTMIAAGFISTATPAMASAVGCVRWGSVYIPVVRVSIPTGQYCFGINGSGTTVNFTDGSVNTPWIVNYTEVVRLYDSYGNNYATFTEPVHNGYAYGYHYWQTGIHGAARVGRACGTLMSAGTAVATACESIY